MKNILSHEVLIETLKQLQLRNESILVSEIHRILAYNAVDQSELQDERADTTKKYYSIDLSIEQIGSIVHMFGDLEVFNLGYNYESTMKSNKFGNLLDKWNELPSYRK